MEITKNDIKKIKELADNPYSYETLLNNISPNVIGQNDIKEAILLALFMGSRKQLDDGTNIKQGINILIITDPYMGTENYFKSIAELSIPNKFKVIQDIKNIEESNLLNILNSDESVFAVGAPKFGRFDQYRILSTQIDLPTQIILAFDLIFLIADKPDIQADSSYSKMIFEKHNSPYQSNCLTNSFFKKYLTYGYVFHNPILTDEANNLLREFYVNTRNSNEYSEIPITSRQLETIIRLAEASAKVKFKNHVEREDAEKAIRLTMNCLKKLGCDFSTGEIDLDFNSIGSTRYSDRDTIQRVTDEIKLLEEEFIGNAPLNVLISNMTEKYDVSKDKTEQIVTNLKNKGIVYVIDNEYVRRAE